MKEEEAKTKKCPINTPQALQFQTCIASDCMMWRSYGRTESVSPKDLGGYCGLAGKP